MPDELVIAMVRERLVASPRFLLDGFPRTLARALALTRLLEDERRGLSAAVFIDAPDDVVVDRIAGRDDDDADTVHRRLRLFHRSTSPSSSITGSSVSSIASMRPDLHTRSTKALGRFS